MEWLVTLIVLVGAALMFVIPPFYHYLILQLTTVGVEAVLVFYLGITFTTYIGGFAAFMLPHPVALMIVFGWTRSKSFEKWFNVYDYGWYFFANWEFLDKLKEKSDKKKMLYNENIRLRMENDALNQKISVYKEIDSLNEISKKYNKIIDETFRRIS